MSVETVTLRERGRIVLPASIRKKFGLKAGEHLTVWSDGGEIRILSQQAALESIRASILKERGSLKGILDEFLAERRAEAARDFRGE